jgi:glycosyltransferase involved in cell wall biosynthesis
MLAHQLGADVLLLIIGAGPGSEAVFTGKIFEYLAAGKAILALIPPGVAADLLMEARIGLVVPPDGPEAIADALTELFTDWQNGKLNISPVPEVVARYNRRRQTKNLANLLDEVRSG